MLNDYLKKDCNLQHIYVEFADGNTIFCDRTFPSGRFATDVLSIPEDVLAGISDLATDALTCLQVISAGMGTSNTFGEFRSCTEKIFRAIGKYPPFLYIDFEAEIESVKKLISEESMEDLLEKEQALLQYFKDGGSIVPTKGETSVDRKKVLEAKLMEMMSFLEQMKAILALPFSVLYFIAVMDTYAGLVVETHARSKSDLACVVHSLFSDDSYFRELNNDLFRVDDFLDYGQNVKIALLPKDSVKHPGETELVEQCLFPNFGQLLMYDFFKGLQAGHYTRKCENCGRYFFVEKATYQRFCSGIDPNNPKRSCQTAGRQLPAGRRQPVGEMPAHVLWKADDELIRKHRQRGKINETAYTSALSLIRGYYEEALCNQEYAAKQYYTDMELPNVYAKVGVTLR